MAKHTLKTCGVHIAGFLLKYVWSFSTIINERVDDIQGEHISVQK